VVETKRDVVVGIPTKNEEATILHVMDSVALGLMEFFYDYDCAVVVVDGGSTDRTLELAKSFRIPRTIVKKVISDGNIKGKGDAIRVILEQAKEMDADMVAILDSDLMSIKPFWVDRLLRPIVFGEADYIFPRYIRDKHDGGITKLVTYPLITTLFGKEVRQPMGGEIGLSNELVEKCLENPLFPSDFGIDTFITMVALANNFRIDRALLGVKLHESTLKYAIPKKHLLPMFYQVVRSLFELMEHYERVWRPRSVLIRAPRMHKRLVRYKGILPFPVKIDLNEFWKEVENLNTRFDELRKIIGDEHTEKVIELVKRKQEGLDKYTWAEIVYMFAAAYKKKKDKRLIELLGWLWLLRYIEWIHETEGLSLARAEDKCFEQLLAFMVKRDLLLEIY